MQRFDTEARVTAALKHAHIIEVLDHGAAHQIPWIAYEYLPGQSLRALLEARPRGLPHGQAIGALVQIADAIELAHARGVLHRDLKPDNVLSTESGAWKVTDFGIAKWTGANAVKTKTGVVLGSPAYLSPEQIEGQPASPASDIYALGIMLFELLNGAPPFADASLMVLLERHLKEEVPPLAPRRPDLPRALDGIIAQATAKRARDRFATAGAFRDALTAIGGVPRASRTLVLRPPAPPRQRTGLLAALVAGLVAVGVGLAALHRSQRAPVPPPAGPGPARESPASGAEDEELSGASALGPIFMQLNALRDVVDRERSVAPRLLDRNLGDARGNAPLRGYVSGLRRRIQAAGEVVRRIAKLSADGPACLMLEPVLNECMDKIDAAEDELGPDVHADTAKEIGELDAAFAALEAHRYGAPLVHAVSMQRERLTGRRAWFDTSTRVERFASAADAIEQADGQERTYAGLCAEIDLLMRAADALSGRLARGDAAAPTQHLTLRRRLLARGDRLLKILGEGGPLDADTMELTPGLDLALGTLAVNALHLAESDEGPAGRMEAVRAWLRIANLAGDAWWWQPSASVADRLAWVDRHAFVAGAAADPGVAAGLARLRAAGDALSRAAFVRFRGVALTEREAHENVSHFGAPGRLSGQELAALIQIDSLIAGLPPRFHSAELLASLVDLVRAAPAAPLTASSRRGLAYAVCKILSSAALAKSRERVPALDDAIEHWLQAQPCVESRWLAGLVAFGHGDQRTALERLGQCLDERFRELAAAPPMGHARPAPVYDVLLMGYALAAVPRPTPDPEPNAKWRPRFEELIGRVGCGLSFDMWRNVRRALR